MSLLPAPALLSHYASDRVSSDRVKTDSADKVSVTPSAIVPGNHNFVVFFYTEDVFGKHVRISEDYTTPKTYSTAKNTESEALEQCRVWAERKIQGKSHFMRGFRIERVVTTCLIDEAPDGITFADASARHKSAARSLPPARSLWNEYNC